MASSVDGGSVDIQALDEEGRHHVSRESGGAFWVTVERSEWEANVWNPSVQVFSDCL